MRSTHFSSIVSRVLKKKKGWKIKNKFAQKKKDWNLIVFKSTMLRHVYNDEDHFGKLYWNTWRLSTCTTERVRTDLYFFHVE